MSAAEGLHTRLGRWQGAALAAGVLGLAGSAVAGLLWPGALFPAYLVAFLFWVGIALGSISLLLLHNLTGGQWGLLIRRPLEAGAMAIVPMAVLFVPVALGLKVLYPWADPEVAAHSEAVRHKLSYLNENAFLLRSGIGFALWIAVAALLNRSAAIRDRSGGVPPRWLGLLSGPGLVLVFFTGSFAAIDWGMSLEPEWYSSIYGVMVIVGWGLLTLASMLVATRLMALDSPEVARVATPGRIQDLGNLMLAFVMLWAYMSFSQFLIIWSGNLAEEIPWYMRRLRGGWGAVAVALVVFHFFVPFFALLFRDTKRNIHVLIRVAVAIIAMHVVDLAWLVLPARSEPLATGFRVPLGAVALLPVTLIGVGGVWIWAFVWNLKRRPLVMAELVRVTPEGGADHG